MIRRRLRLTRNVGACNIARYGEDSEDAIEFSTVLPAPVRRIHTASNFLSNKS